MRYGNTTDRAIDQNLERWRQGIGGESEVNCNISLTFRAQPRHTIWVPVTFIDKKTHDEFE